MMTRITIPVTVDEREALRQLAHKEKRDPRDQARHILRNVLMPNRLEENNSAVVRQDNHSAVAEVVNS